MLVRYRNYARSVGNAQKIVAGASHTFFRSVNVDFCDHGVIVNYITIFFE